MTEGAAWDWHPPFQSILEEQQKINIRTHLPLHTESSITMNVSIKKKSRFQKKDSFMVMMTSLNYRDTQLTV